MVRVITMSRVVRGLGIRVGGNGDGGHSVSNSDNGDIRLKSVLGVTVESALVESAAACTAEIRTTGISIADARTTEAPTIEVRKRRVEQRKVEQRKVEQRRVQWDWRRQRRWNENRQRLKQWRTVG